MNQKDYKKLQTRMFRQYNKMEMKIQKAEEALETIRIALNFFLKDLQDLNPVKEEELKAIADAKKKEALAGSQKRPEEKLK